LHTVENVAMYCNEEGAKKLQKTNSRDTVLPYQKNICEAICQNLAIVLFVMKHIINRTDVKTKF
jgi:hypothetical protein